jgi:uncharacterized protein YukE
MAEKDKMVYGTMEAMAKSFGKAKSQIESTKSQMTKVAKSLDDGALQGAAGNALREAINTKLVKHLNSIAEKMGELEQDINGAVQATRDGVKSAQSRFK